MLLRSGYEYSYPAPATSSRSTTNNRKRKANDDTLDARPLKRQDTSSVLQGEPSTDSLPASLSVSLHASDYAPLPASDHASFSSPLSASDHASLPASDHASLSAPLPVSLSVSLPATLSVSLPAFLPGSVTASAPLSAPRPAPLSAPASIAGSVPAHLSDSFEGTVIGGEFLLLHLLGEGGNAHVYLGQRVTDRAHFAIKVMQKPENDAIMRLQQQEIETQAFLQHVNIVSLHRVLEDEVYFYLVTELCNQGDLYGYLFEGPSEASIPHEQMVKHMFTHILSGVEHMHANSVYHGDLKPENILLHNDGVEHDVVCKVGDFGFATREHFTMEFGHGTLPFIAPEQLDPSKYGRPYDAAAADVWSLGILLIQMLFRVEVPWEQASDNDRVFSMFKRASSATKEQMIPGLSAAMFHLLQSMLAIDAADRPSVSEIKEQFSALDHLFAVDAAAHL